MSKLIEFNNASPKNITAIGGIVVGENNASNQFMARFGTSWRMAPGAEKTYVLFDKIDDAFCVTMCDNHLKFYPGFTKDSFLKAWETDRARSLSLNAWTYELSDKFKYTGLQVMDIYNSFNE